MSELFSKEQLELYRQVFNYLDKSKSGVVYTEFFSDLLRIAGFCPTLAFIRDLENKYSSKKGMTFDEYLQLLSTLDCTVTEDMIRKNFKVFDKYNDGRIKVDLLRSVLTKVGEPLSDKEFDNFLIMMNLKDRDYIEYEELCSVLSSYCLYRVCRFTPIHQVVGYCIRYIIFKGTH